MATNADLEVVESTVDHAIARYRSVVLYIWRGVTSVRAAGLLRQTMDRTRQLEAGGRQGQTNVESAVSVGRGVRQRRLRGPAGCRRVARPEPIGAGCKRTDGAAPTGRRIGARAAR